MEEIIRIANEEIAKGLKGAEATSMKTIERMENALEWKTYLTSVSHEIFRSYEPVSAALFIKLKNNLPRLYFRTSLFCHFGIFKNQRFFRKRHRILENTPDTVSVSVEIKMWREVDDGSDWETTQDLNRG